MKSLFKAIGWTVAMLLIVPNLCAQSVQHGLVQEYHGSESKTPLKNVSVSAANASAAISDEKGEFTLNFRTLHAGDAIQFRRVELSGYEVMNTEALEAARVARNNDNANPNANLLRPQDARTEGSNPNTSLNGKPSTLNIVMIRKEALRQLRDGYRSVAAQRYEKQLKASEAEIERLKKEGQLAEEQYNERMNALEEEYEEKLTKLETYIDKFARIDLSALDQDEQQIIDLVQAGNFDEALSLYEKQNLADRLRQSREDQKKLTAMRNQLDEAAAKKAVENQRLRQSIDRQITLLKMAGGEENYRKVHHILYETFLADTTDVEARKAYALSLRSNGDFEEMCKVLKSGVASVPNDFDRGLLLLDLIVALDAEGSYDAAYSSAQQTESLMSPLQNSNYQVLTRGLPVWSYVMIHYGLVNEKMDICKDVVDRVMLQWTPDSLDSRSLMSYSDLLGAMNDYYSRTGNHEKSLWCTYESFKLNQLLDSQKPWASFLMKSYAEGCSTLFLEGDKEKSLEVIRAASVMLSDRLRKAGNAIAYEEAVTIFYPVIETLVSAEEYALADSVIHIFNDNKVFQKLRVNEQSALQLFVAEFQLFESRVLLYKGEYENAEKLANQSLSVFERHEDGMVLAPYLRLDFDSRLCLAKGQYAAAEKLCNQLIKIGADTFEQSHDSWDAENLFCAYLLMIDIHLASNRLDKAKKVYRQAEKVAAFPCDMQILKKRQLK